MKINASSSYYLAVANLKTKDVKVIIIVRSSNDFGLSFGFCCVFNVNDFFFWKLI